MRHLVTVRRISAIESIPKADRVVLATIDAWNCVVPKGDFEVGDLCVYFEIDSFLVQGQERYEFLMKDAVIWEGQIGVRIRTRHFRNQVSQGLALPLSSFPDVAALIQGLDAVTIRGMDFTEVVGAQKYERAIPGELAGAVIGAKPTYIATTGEERIQNIPEHRIEHANKLYHRTVKLDGYSSTIFNHSHWGESGVCGHYWWYDETQPLDETQPNPYVQVALESGILDAVRRYGRNIALQGELVGPGICDNIDDLPEKQFRLFNIWDIDKSRYLSQDERAIILADLQELGVTVLQVPSLGIVRLGDMGSIEDMIKAATGPSLNPKVNREGDVYSAVDGSDSFKVISNVFLMTNPDA
jgi:RNA ligase (TIGR02306 family)